MQIKIPKARIAPFVYLLQKIFFRMTLFSFFIFISLTLLYAAGNFQKFLDSTQASVLQSLIFIAITLMFFSALSIATSVLDTFLSRIISRRKIIAMGFYALSVLVSGTVMVAARTVLTLAAGTE